MVSLSDKDAAPVIRQFLIEDVLKCPDTITFAEIRLLQQIVPKHLKKLLNKIEKAPLQSTECYIEYLLTAVSLKCIVSMANAKLKE